MMATVFTVVMALSFQPANEPVTTNEQLADLRQKIALMQQDVNQLKIIAGENRVIMNDMPRMYVPRSEHDLRDQRSNYAERISELKSEMLALRAKQDADKNDFYKALIGLTVALAGGGGLGYFIKTKTDEAKGKTGTEPEKK